MKRTSCILKSISSVMLFIFTVTTVAWSAPMQTIDDRQQTTDSVAQEAKGRASDNSRLRFAASQSSRHSERSEESQRSFGNSSGDMRSSTLQASSPNPSTGFTAPLAWKIQVPKNIGTVSARWVGRKKGSGTQDVVSSGVTSKIPTVVILQDSHCNIEAQKNIAGIIESLSADTNVSVFVEGAIGELDVAEYHSFNNKNIRNTVCDFFLSQGKISGAEYAAITSKADVPFIGVEDRELYLKNYNAFTAITHHKGPLEEEVEQIEAVLDLLKEKMYSAELLSFESEYIAFRQEQIDFFGYAKQLMARAEGAGIDMFAYPNMSLFKEVDTREGRIDFEQLETEVNSFLGELFEKLETTQATDGLTRLKRFTTQYAQGVISNSDYFSYALKLGRMHKLNLLPYTSFYEYTQYLTRYERIDKKALRFERRKIEKEIKETIVSSQHASSLQERDAVFELLRLSEQLHFTKNLINTRVFNQDIEDFEAARNSFRAKEYIDFILRTAPKHNISYRISLNFAYLDRVIPKVYDFYSASIERDEAMVSNLLNARIDTDVSDTDRHGSSNVSVLVAGGFHTQGLRNELEKRGISYVVVAPNISKVQDNQHELYTTRMLGGVDDFDLAILDLMGNVPQSSLRVTELPVQQSFFAQTVSSFLAIMSKFANGFTDNTLEKEVFKAGFDVLSQFLGVVSAELSLADMQAHFGALGVQITELGEADVSVAEVVDITTAENGRNAIITLVRNGSVTFKIANGRYVRVHKGTSDTAAKQEKQDDAVPEGASQSDAQSDTAQATSQPTQQEEAEALRIDQEKGARDAALVETLSEKRKEVVSLIRQKKDIPSAHDLNTTWQEMHDMHQNGSRFTDEMIAQAESLLANVEREIENGPGFKTRVSRFTKSFFSSTIGLFLMASVSMGITACGSATQSSTPSEMNPPIQEEVIQEQSIESHLERVEAITDLSGYEAYYNQNINQDVFTSGQVMNSILDTLQMMLDSHTEVQLPSGEVVTVNDMLASVDRIQFVSAEAAAGNSAWLNYDQISNRATMTFNADFLNVFSNENDLSFFMMTTYGHEAQHAYDLRNTFNGLTLYSQVDSEYTGWIETRGHFQSDFWEKVWANQTGSEYSGRWEWTARHLRDADSNGVAFNGLLAKSNKGEMSSVLLQGHARDTWMVGLNLFENYMRDNQIVSRTDAIEFNNLSLEMRNGQWTGIAFLQLTINGEDRFVRFQMHDGGPVTDRAQFTFTTEMNDCGVPEGIPFDLSQLNAATSRADQFEAAKTAQNHDQHMSPRATYIADAAGVGKVAAPPVQAGAFIRGGPVRAATNFITNIIGRLWNLSPEKKSEIAVKYVAPLVETSIFAMPSVFLGPWGIIAGAGFFALAHIFHNFTMVQRLWSSVFARDASKRQSARTELLSSARAVDWKAVALASVGNALSAFGAFGVVFGVVGLIGAIAVHVGTNTWRFNVYKLESAFEEIKKQNPDMTQEEYIDKIRAAINVLKKDHNAYDAYSAELEQIFPGHGAQLLSSLILASGFTVDTANISDVIESVRVKMGHYLMRNYLQDLKGDTLQRIARDVLRPTQRYNELSGLGSRITGFVEQLQTVVATEANLTKIFDDIQAMVDALPSEISSDVTQPDGVFDVDAGTAGMLDYLGDLLNATIAASTSAKAEQQTVFESFRAIVEDPNTTLSDAMVRDALGMFGVDLAKLEKDFQEAEEAVLEAEEILHETLMTLDVTEEDLAAIKRAEYERDARREVIEKQYLTFLDRMLGHVYRNNIDQLKDMVTQATTEEEMDMVLNLIEGGDFIERGEAFDANEYDADVSQIDGQSALLDVAAAQSVTSQSQQKRIKDLQVGLTALRANEMERGRILQQISKFGSRRRGINTEFNSLVDAVNQFITSSEQTTLKDVDGNAVTVDRATILRDVRIAPLLKALQELDEKIEIVDNERTIKQKELDESIAKIESTEAFAEQQMLRSANEADKEQFEKTLEWCQLEKDRLNSDAAGFISKLKEDFNELSAKRETLSDLQEKIASDATVNAILSQDALTDQDVAFVTERLVSIASKAQQDSVLKINDVINDYQTIIENGEQVVQLDKADIYASEAGRAVMEVYFTAETEKLKNSAKSNNGVLVGKDLNRAIALAEVAYMSYKGYPRARRGQLIAVMLLLQQSKKDPEKYEKMIAQLPTGQGKTAVTAMTSFVQSLSGGGVFAISTTDFLANEGYVEASNAYKLTGTSVGFVGTQVQGQDRIEQYETDITYIAIGTLAHDIATDKYGSNQKTRGEGDFNSTTFGRRDYSKSYAVVDEIDSVSVFQAKTRFIRSDGEGKITESEKKLRKAVQDVIAGDQSTLTVVNQKLEFIDKKTLAAQERGAEQGRYDVVIMDNGQHVITEKGRQSLETQLSGVVNRLSAVELARMQNDLGLTKTQSNAELKEKIMEELLDYADAAVTANYLEQENKGYIVVKDTKGNPVEIVLMDLNTGVKQDNMRRRGGIHKALEAKHGAPIKGDSETLNSIAVSDLFNKFLYGVTGMTGTAESVERIFRKLYGMFVQIVPPDTVNKRIDKPREIYKTDLEMRTGLVDGAIENLLNGDATLLISDNRTENYDIKTALARRLNMRSTRDLLKAQGITVTFSKGRAIMGNIENLGELEVNQETGEIDQSEIDQNIIIEVHNANNGETFAINTYDGETSKDLEKRIIDEDAGKAGAITLATNVGGRGSDYKLFEDAVRRGLRVFVNGIGENIGIDQQAKGRSARQTSSGLSRQFISLERDWDFLTKAFTRPVFSRMRELLNPDRLGLWLVNKFWTFMALDIVKNRVNPGSWLAQLAFRSAQYMQTRQLEFDLTRNLEYDVIETQIQLDRRTFVDVQEMYNLYEFGDKDVPADVKEYLLQTLATVAKELKENDKLTSQALLFEDPISIVDVSKLLSSDAAETKADRDAIKKAFIAKVKKDVQDVSAQKQILDLFDRMVNRPEVTQTELVMEIVGNLEKPGFLTKIVGDNLLIPDESARLLKPDMTEEEMQKIADHMFEIFGVHINVEQALKKEGETGMEIHSEEELVLRISTAIARAFGHAQFERIVNDATGKLFSELETIRNKTAKEFEEGAKRELNDFQEKVRDQVRAKRQHGEFEKYIAERMKDRQGARLKNLAEYKERSEREESFDDDVAATDGQKIDADLSPQQETESMFQVFKRALFDRKKLVRSYQLMDKTEAADQMQQTTEDVLDAEAAQRKEEALAEQFQSEMAGLSQFLNPLSAESQQQADAATKEEVASFVHELAEGKVKISKYGSDDDDKDQEEILTLDFDDENAEFLSAIVESDQNLLGRIADQKGKQFADIVKHNGAYAFVAVSDNNKLVVTSLGDNVSKEYVRAVMDVGSELDQMSYMMKYHSMPPEVKISDAGVIEIGDVDYDKETVAPGAVVKSSQLDDGVTLEAGAMVEGSTLHDGEVRSGAYVKSTVTIGQNMVVDSGARLERVDADQDDIVVAADTELTNIFLTRDDADLPDMGEGDHLRGKFEGKKYILEHITKEQLREKVYELKERWWKRLWLKMLNKRTQGSMRDAVEEIQKKQLLPAEFITAEKGREMQRAIKNNDLQGLMQAASDDSIQDELLTEALLRKAIKKKSVAPIVKVLLEDAQRHFINGKAKALISDADGTDTEVLREEALSSFDRAEKVYKIALSILPAYEEAAADAFFKLGLIHEERGVMSFGRTATKKHLEDAGKMIDHALTIDRDDVEVKRAQKRVNELDRLRVEVADGAGELGDVSLRTFVNSINKRVALDLPSESKMLKRVGKWAMIGAFGLAVVTSVGMAGILLTALYKFAVVQLVAGSAAAYTAASATTAGWYSVFAPLLSWVSGILPAAIAPEFWTLGGYLTSKFALAGPMVHVATYAPLALLTSMPILKKKLFKSKPKKPKYAWMKHLDQSQHLEKLWSGVVRPILQKMSPSEAVKGKYSRLDGFKNRLKESRDTTLLNMLSTRVRWLRSSKVNAVLDALDRKADLAQKIQTEEQKNQSAMAQLQDPQSMQKLGQEGMQDAMQEMQANDEKIAELNTQMQQATQSLVAAIGHFDEQFALVYRVYGDIDTYVTGKDAAAKAADKDANFAKNDMTMQELKELADKLTSQYNKPVTFESLLSLLLPIENSFMEVARELIEELGRNGFGTDDITVETMTDLVTSLEPSEEHGTPFIGEVHALMQEYGRDLSSAELAKVINAAVKKELSVEMLNEKISPFKDILKAAAIEDITTLIQTETEKDELESLHAALQAVRPQTTLAEALRVVAAKVSAERIQDIVPLLTGVEQKAPEGEERDEALRESEFASIVSLLKNDVTKDDLSLVVDATTKARPETTLSDIGSMVVADIPANDVRDFMQSVVGMFDPKEKPEEAQGVMPAVITLLRAMSSEGDDDKKDIAAFDFVNACYNAGLARPAAVTAVLKAFGVAATSAHVSQIIGLSNTTLRTLGIPLEGVTMKELVEAVATGEDAVRDLLSEKADDAAVVKDVADFKKYHSDKITKNLAPIIDFFAMKGFDVLAGDTAKNDPEAALMHDEGQAPTQLSGQIKMYTMQRVALLLPFDRVNEEDVDLFIQHIPTRVREDAAKEEARRKLPVVVEKSSTYAEYFERVMGIMSRDVASPERDLRAKAFKELSRIAADEIFNDTRLLEKERTQLLSFIMTLRDGMTMSDVQANSIDTVFDMVVSAVKNKIVSDTAHRKLEPFTIFFNLGLLSEAYAYDESPDKGLVASLLVNFNQVNKVLSDMGVTIQPYYHEGFVSDELREFAESLMLDTTVKESALLTSADIDGTLTLVSTTESAPDKENFAKMKDVFGSKLDIMIARNAFVPKVYGNSVQMLTLDILFARIASFYAENKDLNAVPQDYFTQSADIFSFSSPIYISATDEIANEIKQASFAVAA